MKRQDIIASEHARASHVEVNRPNKCIRDVGYGELFSYSGFWNGSIEQFPFAYYTMHCLRYLALLRSCHVIGLRVISGISIKLAEIFRNLRFSLGIENSNRGRRLNTLLNV